METRIDMLQEERSHVTSRSPHTQERSISRLKWAVAFCFVLLCVLALFTVCSLQEKKDKEPPNMHESRALYIKPKAHLTGTRQTDPGVQDLQWESKLGLAFLHGMIYSNKSLIVPEDGYYFVYSQLSFRPPCNDDKSTSLSVLLYTPKYPDPEVILSGISFCTKGSKIYQPIYVGGLHYLEKGDQLRVNIEHVSLLDTSQHKTFFGAFLV